MKTYIPFKTFLIFAFTILSTVLKAQEHIGETYLVTNNGSVSNIQPYLNALNNSNMKYHRLKNSRYTIIFDTGVTVQLFSAVELVANGRTINISDYPESFDSNRFEPVFSLGANNYILELRRSNSKK